MNSRKLNIRGLNYHIQEWGDSSKPLLILLHGWMDCGATYKFVSEYLISDYFLVAPDWRGFGQTDHGFLIILLTWKKFLTTILLIQLPI